MEFEEPACSERWELTRAADGDEVIILLGENGEDITVLGGNEEGYSADRNEIVNSLLPGYEAQGYAITSYLDWRASRSKS